MSHRLRLLQEYASHRRFVESIAGAANHPDAHAAKTLLLATTEIAEGVFADDETFAQCAIVWNGDRFASGIYLGGRIVLTASHVVIGVNPTMVSIGVSNINQRFGTKDFRVASSVSPAGTTSGEWDVAILVLKSEGPQSGTVRIATASDFAAAQTASGGAGVTVCGFGLGWPPGHPELLESGVKRSMDVPIAELEAPTTNPANFFVAGDRSETAPFHNICKFDSGAPAFVGDSNSMTLLGIASSTFDLDGAMTDGCGSKPLGVFSRVDVRRDWILDVIDQHRH